MSAAAFPRPWNANYKYYEFWHRRKQAGYLEVPGGHLPLYLISMKDGKVSRELTRGKVRAIPTELLTDIIFK
jgi:hypothetical protein